MSPFPMALAAYDAAAVNEAIRAIVVGAQGRQWTVAERALYELLRDESVRRSGRR
ncbi:hypothetical protein SCALM49S_03951 [Streptomyces californicus]